MAMFQAVLGIFIIVATAQLFSERRRNVNWRLIVSGLGIQLLLGLALLKLPILADLLGVINRMVAAIEIATQSGMGFVFGYLGGGATPFEQSDPGANFILAFRALPLILVFSVISALLWYWRILPVVISGFAKMLEKTMGVGGAVGVGSASSIFIGMVESPLLIKPYLQKMSRSELFVVMTCGMATVAGTVMALYAGFLSAVLDDALSHIIIASVMSAPAAIMIALLMVPSDNETTTGHVSEIDNAIDYDSTMDAITKGTQNGLSLLLSIVATLVVFIALVSLANQLLSLIPVSGEALTLQKILGWVFSPLAWLLGIPWEEAKVAGSLLGTKTILNELIAYLQLSALPENTLSDKSELIISYALCGFANLGSLGILVGGMLSMAPERRSDILSLAPLTLLSGTMATCLTGAVVGLLY